MDDDWVARSQLLASLEPAARTALFDRLRPRFYQRGQVLFNDGDHGDCMHLVRSGRLDVRITTSTGQTVILRIVQPGELVGEMALVHDGHRRMGRVSAIEDAQTYALYQRDFEEIRLAHPGIDRFLVRALSERVLRTSELVRDLMQPPEQRIWRQLAVLADAYGDEPIRMSQDDLAHAAGTVRQTANRILQLGVRCGAIELDRGVIRVIDRSLLARLADTSPG